MKIEQLAINSVSTRHEDLVEALDAYAAAGFRNVEFVLPHVKDWLARGHDVDDVRHLLAARNLRAIGGFEKALECFSAPESRQANYELHLRNARLIHEFGGGTLVVGTDGPAQPVADPLAALDTVAGTLSNLARQIEGLDVSIALEFNWGPLIKSLHSAVLVAARVDHPQVGVLFDPAHYHTTPTKFEHLTATTVRWIKHVHLNDMRDKPGDLSNCNSDRVLPGEGILDLEALIATLERYGYNGYFSIEMFNEDLWHLPAAEAARRCYASLIPLCR
ncbi:MAG TPA: sugar phosphate isomerase/epimerase [Chloroflexota bacterium]|nr:sugar phosphate isomerase/epimerase [Chloroflexota bacterium]